MKKWTGHGKAEAELDIRLMSEKARKWFYGTDGIDVCKMSDGTYSMCGWLGDIDGFAFEELEDMFESYANEDLGEEND